MTDTYSGGLPPVDLPKWPALPPAGEAPVAQPRIRVTPSSPDQGPPLSGQGSPDPWAEAGFSSTPPKAAESAPAAKPEADPWAAAGFADKPPEPKAPHRDIGKAEAGVRGFESGVTFGLAPAIAGTHKAGLEALPKEAQDAIEKHGHEPVLGALVAGLARLGYENLIAPALGIDPRDKADAVSGGDTHGPATKTYQKTRQARLEEDQAAREQQPAAFIPGQIVGAIANPTSGLARTGATVASVSSRLPAVPSPTDEGFGKGGVGRGAKAGAVGGGLYGAGEAISEGKDLGGIAEEAGKGVATGTTFGTATGAVLESGAKGVNRVKSLARGAHDPDAEAARIVLEDLNRARGKRGLPAFTREELDAANAAGSPRALVDLGDEKTRAVARVAANKSPEGREALDLLTDTRYRSISPRVADFIRNRTGSRDAGGDLEALKTAAQKANRPAYRGAYAAGDRPIWNAEIERLTSADEVQSAIRDAVKRGSNRAVADGLGGFNPPVTVHPDGRFTFNKGPTGVPTYPNIQFWDYVQRELRDSYKSLERTGRFEQADAVNQLRGQLNAQLDKLVPQFGKAREGAFGFFKAENALEAGQKAVMMNVKLPDMQRALAKMNPVERELFRRGFAAELADRIEPLKGRGAIDAAFVVSQPAKNKIVAALGRDFALELEALLRVETHLDKTRRALGNSTTTRQLHEMQNVGGAMATVEAVKEHGFSPSHMIATIFGIKALSGKIEHIDQKVAQKVAELLASDNPASLAKGVKIVSSSPRMMNALRKATSGGAIVGAHDIGPEATISGIGAVGQKLIGSHGEPHHAHDAVIDQVSQ